MASHLDLNRHQPDRSRAKAICRNRCACKPTHFVPSDLPLLVRYVEALALADEAAEQLHAEGAVVDGKPSPWLVVLEKCQRAVVALSMRLRLSPQSRLDPKNIGPPSTAGAEAVGRFERLTSRGSIISTPNPTGYERAWWVRKADAARLVEESRERGNVEASAKRLGIAVTVHEIAIMRADKAVARSTPSWPTRTKTAICGCSIRPTSLSDRPPSRLVKLSCRMERPRSD